MFQLILQLHAHKIGSGSFSNGRDSNAQRLGTKCHDGQVVTMLQVLHAKHTPGQHVYPVIS